MTFTPTNSATDTPTPTNTATPTATETFTPTAENTATATNTPTPEYEVTGTVTYGNAIGAPAAPRFVPNVLVSADGSPALSDTTAGAGTYLLTGFGAGSYTVTPSKTGQTSAISSFDAGKISQFVTGNTSFSAAQSIVADVSGSAGISSFDAALIARYAAALGSPTGSTGTWIFGPASRFYSSITGSLSGEDYSALLMGEISGNYNPAGARPINDDGPERSIAVDVPNLVTSVDKDLVIPFTVQGAANKDIIAYEFDLRYDPAVIQPQTDPVDLAGTASRGLFVVTNSTEPGLLRVVVYGPMPISENGILLNLKFAVVGAPGLISPITIERMMFNEGEPSAIANGQVEISY